MVKDRLLRVEAGHFIAGAIFGKGVTSWHLIECAPILGWMRGKHLDEIKRQLEFRRYKYQWL